MLSWFNLFRFLLPFIVISQIGCKREKPFEIQRITIQSGSVQVDNVKPKDKQSAKIYAEVFVNSYLKTLRSVIPPGFSVGLPLLETNVSVNLIYSEQADCFFIFYPSNKNELIIEPTALPAQLVVFDKADLDGSNLDSTIRSLLPRYQDWTARWKYRKWQVFKV